MRRGCGTILSVMLVSCGGQLVPVIPDGVHDTGTSSAASDDAALVRAVNAALTSKALGTDVTVSVLDVATGRSIMARAA